MPKKGEVIDMAGKVFGELEVTDLAGIKSDGAMWNCICECGKKIQVAGSSLRDGSTRSCGCYSKDATRNSWYLRHTGEGR